MNIVEQAEKDLDFTLEDMSNGFGVPIVLESPADQGNVRFSGIICKTNDVNFYIEPGTNIGVSSSIVEVDIRLSTLKDLGIDVNQSFKGWKIEFNNVVGENKIWTVQISPNDNKLGILKLILERVNISGQC